MQLYCNISATHTCNKNIERRQAITTTRKHCNEQNLNARHNLVDSQAMICQLRTTEKGGVKFFEHLPSFKAAAHDQANDVKT